MRVLVDTHTFIWALSNDPRLSAKAAQVIRSNADELLFSLVSLWEMSIKMKLGKLNILGSSIAYVQDELDSRGIEVLGIRYKHVLGLELLPLHHNDPFDRLLIAQASVESLPVRTHDQRFAQYGVPVIW